MTAIDWVGLWAAIQVIGIIVSVIFVGLLVLIGVVYVVGGTIWDEYKRKRAQ